MGRAPCCDKDKVKKGPWSPEEDAKLKAYIDTHGTGNNWIALPQKIGLMRCGKSCRLRWLNYLRPNIKHGGFSEEEDSIICSLYISIGSRWSIIAAQLPGRTDNDIKNYWNTRLKKKLLGRRKASHINRLSASGQEPKDSDGVDNNSMSNSALERLQLHMQLQGLQNPFSLFNHPALWPKLNPLQEKMIQTLQSFNDNSNLSMRPIHHPGQGQNVEFNEPKLDKLENSLLIAFNSGSTNIIPDSTIVPKSGTQIVMNSGTRTISTFQAQIDDFINNKSVEFGENDCFKEMEGSTDNMIWWSNEFDSNSASSISWDSTNCVLHQSDDVVYQDFGFGYDMARSHDIKEYELKVAEKLFHRDKEA